MILAREKRLALQHFREDAACAPDVHFDVVLLPREHDLGCSVVSRGDVARHLRVLYTRQAEVADLEVAIFVHEDVRGFEVAMDYTRRMHVFEAALLWSVIAECSGRRLDIPKFDTGSTG